MEYETFLKAVELAEQRGYDCVTVGGGEPTLHPRFFDMVCLLLGRFDNVWLVTNGSQVSTSLTLAKMARRGILGVALSVDCYHAPISPKVYEAFTEGKPRAGLRWDGKKWRKG